MASVYAGQYQGELRDLTGRALVAANQASILVKVAGTNTNATLYNQGGTLVALATLGAAASLGNPLPSANAGGLPGIDSAGNFTFFADASLEYDLIYTVAGATVPIAPQRVSRLVPDWREPGDGGTPGVGSVVDASVAAGAAIAQTKIANLGPDLAGKLDTTATPQAKAGDLNLRGRVIVKDDGWIDLRDHAAWDPIAADNQTAIQAALTLAKTKKGSRLTFVPGQQYKFVTPLNFDQAQGVTLEGAVAPTFNGSPTPDPSLIYTGSGSASAISARSTVSTTLRNLRVVYTSNTFTGSLVDFSQVSGGGDTTKPKMDNVELRGSSAAVVSCLQLVNLTQAIFGEFSGVVMSWARDGMNGKVGGPAYSNSHTFTSCTSVQLTGWSFKNAHEQWTFVGCGFEADVNGKPNAYSEDYPAYGPVVFLGGWMGDAAGTGQPWIKWTGQALQLVGVKMQSSGGQAGVEWGGTASGASVGLTISGGLYELGGGAIVKTVTGAASPYNLIIDNPVLAVGTTLYDESAAAILGGKDTRYYGNHAVTGLTLQRVFGGGTGVKLTSDLYNPNSVAVQGAVGDLYIKKDGGTGSYLWRCTTAPSTWTAIL